jgi:AcrR family transcriptional regulator
MAVTVIEGRISAMGRWDPDARGRLMKAAMELYAERGFELTTVADIAAKAGLTERTFFRHFTDKREVLFSVSPALQELMVCPVAMAPESAAPIETVAGVEAAASVIRDRKYSRERHKLIEVHPVLRERELIKMASLASAFAATLRKRAVNDPAANLTAEAGIAVFRIAFERWVKDSGNREFVELIREEDGELGR